ncbi:MAG: hypothetical protein AAF456_04875 [Planctomycetota bacterium]
MSTKPVPANQKPPLIWFVTSLFSLLVFQCGCLPDPADSTGRNVPVGTPESDADDQDRSPSTGTADPQDQPSLNDDGESGEPSPAVNQLAAEAIAIEEQRRQANQSADASDDVPEQEQRVLVQRDLVAGTDGVFDITFDDIMFEMETGEEFSRNMLTQNVRTLHKERIRIRGYIHPSAQRTGNTNFIFVRDDKECCFGPQAALFDCILVSLDENVTADFSARPISVEGLFFVREYKIGDQILAIYNMRHGRVN